MSVKEIATQTEIRRAAIRYLARRDYARREIAQKLKAKNYPSEEIETVLTDLVQTGLLSDERFAESFIHWRQNRGYGPQRISMELQARGVAHEMIAELLQITDNAWFTGARKVWQKHFKNKPPADFKDKARQMRFLQYRGFTQEQIDSVFDE